MVAERLRELGFLLRANSEVGRAFAFERAASMIGVGEQPNTKPG